MNPFTPFLFDLLSSDIKWKHTHHSLFHPVMDLASVHFYLEHMLSTLQPSFTLHTVDSKTAGHVPLAPSSGRQRIPRNIQFENETG